MQIVGIDKRRPFKSFQGEGPYAGQRIVGLRFMQCNLKCQWRTAMGDTAWCDTKWTWDGSEKGETWDIDELVKAVIKEAGKRLPSAKWEEAGLFSSFKKAKIIMVTGGEPMLRQGTGQFQYVLTKLRAAGFKIHVETNGTIAPNEWARNNIDFFDVSPKYQLYPEKYNKQLIRDWENCGVQVAWKFVVGTMDDVFSLQRWVETMDMKKDDDIWFMPLTTDQKSMEEARDIINNGVVNAFKETYLGFKNVHISPRLQIRGNFP